MDERRVERLVARVNADAKMLEEMKGVVAEAIAHARGAVARSRRLRQRVAARRAGHEGRGTGAPAGP